MPPENVSFPQVIAPATIPITAEDFQISNNTSIWWLSGSGFLINSRGTLIMMDPVLMMKPGSQEICELDMRMLVPLPILATEVPKLDAILYTHLDEDHLAPLTAPALIRTGGFYGGPAIVVQQLEHLGIPAEQARSFQIGDSFRVGDVEITLTLVDHSWQNLDPEKYGTPWGSDDCCGFLIHTPDGTIWYTGDSRLLPEHMELSGVDVLLLDVSNDPYHFGVEGAIKLANHHKSAHIIAHHYGTYDAPDVLAFNGNPGNLISHISSSESRFHLLAPGERFMLQTKISEEQLYEVEIEKNVPLTLQDGTILYSHIYYPISVEKFPALLMRTPYGKEFAGADGYFPPEWYARQGYIVVIQDTRGRFHSEGKWELYKYEAQDGAATIQFVKNLPKCNGKVGMYGFSYVGATQLHAAAEMPEGLVTITPTFTNDGYYEDWTYKNGALHLAFIQWWSLYLLTDQRVRKEISAGKLSEILKNLKQVCSDYEHLPINDHPKITKDIAPFYNEFLEHPTFDEYWKQWHLGNKYQNLDIPALHIGGWYDIFIDGTIRNFTNMTKQTKKQQKLVIGPWYHVPWNNVTGHSNRKEEQWDLLDEVLIKWFNFWLKNQNNNFVNEPPVAIYVMGENKWRQEHEWPLARTQYEKFYIHSQGSANSLKGDGTLDRVPPENETPDIYVYNPFTPVPSLGGHSCCVSASVPMGTKDQRPVEIRKDVLVYTTEELRDDMEVTGSIEAVIYAASDVDDTDFTVKVVDVHPDGRAMNLVEGIQRASFRLSNETPTPIEPGKIYEYRFQVGTTSNLFKKGHKIRIEISSSNFPTFERNLNMFNLKKDGTYFDIKDATQKIFHNKEYQTHIVFPIIPR